MAEPKSWIKLNRNILDWGWYKDGNTMRVFTHLLLTANVKDGRFMGIIVRRGEVATSVATIAKELNLSTKEVRTAVEHLKKTDEVASKPYNRFSLITIKNYELYQGEAASRGQTGGKQAANNRQQSKNNRKKEIKKKEDIVSNGDSAKPKKYLPQAWELEIPREMWGKFSTEDDYWAYAEGGDCT